MPENTAVYPTKYYAEQLKDIDPRFYVERQMVVVIPHKDPNTDYPPEAIVLPSIVKAEYLFEPRLEEGAPDIRMVEVPFEWPIPKPVLEITTEDLRHALRSDVIQELGTPQLNEREIQEIRQKLLSWIDTIAEAKSLRLTDEAKLSLANLMALIMKKADESIKQS